ncbi:hypothetical protein TRVA0_037S01420 [Trichomonascus vanleenenianus]|uniref:Urn1p n=1 Tax=Trichomonascus vanleenenianus TaxID=2268995 RepID=UPI003ECA1314
MESALPSGWSRHVAPSGHYYYYNSKTGESTYDKPDLSSTVDKKKKKRRRPHKPADRPKLKLELADGPWVLVFCKSGRRFVHNSETSKSYWNAPEEIQTLVEALDRNLVIEHIARARGLKLAEPREEKQPNEEEHELIEEELKGEPRNEEEPELIANYSESSSESDNEPEKESENESSEGEFVFEDFQEEEEEEEEEEETLSEEEKQKRFGEMLNEHSISPLSTWQLEMNKLVNDPRYDLFSSLQQRQIAFDAWATQKIAATKKPSNDAATSSPEQKFAEFIVSEYTPKFKFYLDFKRRLRKDPRFSESPLTDREKETLFRHTSKALRLPEPERQEKLKQLY